MLYTCNSKYGYGDEMNYIFTSLHLYVFTSLRFYVFTSLHLYILTCCNHDVITSHPAWFAWFINLIDLHVVKYIRLKKNTIVVDMLQLLCFSVFHTSAIACYY